MCRAAVRRGLAPLLPPRSGRCECTTGVCCWFSLYAVASGAIPAGRCASGGGRSWLSPTTPPPAACLQAVRADRRDVSHAWTCGPAVLIAMMVDALSALICAEPGIPRLWVFAGQPGSGPSRQPSGVEHLTSYGARLMPCVPVLGLVDCTRHRPSFCGGAPFWQATDELYAPRVAL